MQTRTSGRGRYARAAGIRGHVRKAHLQCIGRQFMADRGLGQERHRLHQRRDVVQVQVVPGIDHQTGRTCPDRRSRRSVRGSADAGRRGTPRHRPRCRSPRHRRRTRRTRSITSGSGSMNRITRHPNALIAAIAGVASAAWAGSSFQPSSDVKASGSIGHQSRLLRPVVAQDLGRTGRRDNPRY